MNKQKLLISSLTVGAAGILAYSLLSGNVYAQINGQNSPLIQRIVDKFNLDQEEVNALVGEYQIERRAEMQSNSEERLNQEVEKGNITSEQRDKIIAKRTEMQSEMIGQQDLTSDERKAKMEEHRTEMEQWAEENGIDVKYIMGFGMGSRGGLGNRDYAGQMKGRGSLQGQ